MRSQQCGRQLRLKGQVALEGSHISLLDAVNLSSSLKPCQSSDTFYCLGRAQKQRGFKTEKNLKKVSQKRCRSRQCDSLSFESSADSNQHVARFSSSANDETVKVGSIGAPFFGIAKDYENHHSQHNTTANGAC